MEIKIQNSKIQKYNLKLKNAQVRFLNEMRNVLYDQPWLKTAKNFPVYYIWRGVEEKNGLRYDITIIPPKMLGGEFPKTKGHKHLNNFSELITVLAGEAFYLSQRGKNDKIDKIEVIKAKKGDWLIYPPNCEHLTINPGQKNLVMANWLPKKCQSDYSLFEKFGGAGYFYTKDGWLKNKKYKKVPKIRFKKPFKKAPKNLDFLYGN